MNIDARPITQMHPDTRRRRLLGVTAASAAALGVIALPGGSRAFARTEEGQALVGSWMVAAIAPGAQPGPPRILVSFTGDGVAMAYRAGAAVANIAATESHGASPVARFNVLII